MTPMHRTQQDTKYRVKRPDATLLKSKQEGMGHLPLAKIRGISLSPFRGTVEKRIGNQFHI
jgi:hypothetical protein